MFSYGESVTPPPPHRGTAEPRRPHLRVGKLRLRETRQDSPGSFLHVQYPTILSWLVVTWLLVSVRELEMHP